MTAAALARATEWLNVVDPETGMKGIRQTNTMPQYRLLHVTSGTSTPQQLEGWDSEGKVLMPVGPRRRRRHASSTSSTPGSGTGPYDLGYVTHPAWSGSSTRH